MNLAISRSSVRRLLGRAARHGEANVSYKLFSPMINASGRFRHAHLNHTPIRTASFSTLSYRTLHTIPRSRFLLTVLPVFGGLLFLFYPRPPALLPDVLESPTLIPCNNSAPHPHFISSPAEPGDITSRILSFLHNRIWRPIRISARFLHLLVIFVPVIFTCPIIILGSRRCENWWYGLLTAQMQRAGPTFTKLAQWAASRTDLFPDALCERLGALHSSGKPHPMKHTRRVIESIFHRPFEEVFEEFEETPIGSGAIAQVYRAKLRSDLLPLSYLDPKRPRPPPTPIPLPSKEPAVVPTNTVAVKVLHPNVTAMISRDLSIMRFFARFINLFPNMEWLSLPEEVEVFGTMMNEQLDLRHEARNLEQFEKNFSKRNSAVAFPRPLTSWSNQDLLIEEYQNALPLRTFLRNGGGPYDHQIADIGLDAFLTMLLLDNFAHSDLHPGNIMVKFYKPSTTFLLETIVASILNWSWKPGNPANGHDTDKVVSRLRALAHDPPAWQRELSSLAAQGYQPEIVFIDTGLVTSLDPHNRRNFLDLFRAVARFDGYTTGKLMVERCRTPELAIEPEIFALKMQHLILSIKARTFSLARIKISDILQDVLKSVREHHVKMEGDFINTVLSILLLEGIGRQLNPNMDLFKSALPILRKVGRQMTAKEAIAEGSSGDVGAMLKIYLWLEARELASAAFQNADELVRYDWLMPNV